MHFINLYNSWETNIQVRCQRNFLPVFTSNGGQHVVGLRVEVAVSGEVHGDGRLAWVTISSEYSSNKTQIANEKMANEQDCF